LPGSVYGHQWKRRDQLGAKATSQQGRAGIQLNGDSRGVISRGMDDSSFAQRIMRFTGGCCGLISSYVGHRFLSVGGGHGTRR
jgi:hypothetical protein